MISKKYDDYEIYIDESTNKVMHALIDGEDGFEKVYPYKYDNAYNCWTNVSGSYSYDYTKRLYRKGEIIFR